jgi:hypothetical protein
MDPSVMHVVGAAQREQQCGHKGGIGKPLNFRVRLYLISLNRVNDPDAATGAAIADPSAVANITGPTTATATKGYRLRRWVSRCFIDWLRFLFIPRLVQRKESVAP